MSEPIIPRQTTSDAGDPKYGDQLLGVEGEIPLPPIVFTKTKAIIAAITGALVPVGMFSVQISDGHFTWTEAAALIAAVGGWLATVLGVHAAPNQIKNTDE